jgi:hypothetical protein
MIPISKNVVITEAVFTESGNRDCVSTVCTMQVFVLVQWQDFY